MPLLRTLLCVAGVLLPTFVRAADANRLTYLDSNDPYYVSRTFPRLETPQWVGEAGVDAVIVLAIDDMRGHEKWETFLRPILERLKRVDGRAPVSIMTCQIDPADPHLQQWLKEGVSLETHTYGHPCPLMADGNFPRAKATYDKCVDQMFAVPNNVPVAFRMPCCDSLDTPSPRFWSEIFNRLTPSGHFLTTDSSVFNVPTPNDPDLPRDLVFEPDGRERFRKYLPFKSFVNTVDDYPYPYVINRLCWEMPCVVPSDWEGFNVQGKFNPTTVNDMKAAVDVTVAKRGVFDLVFHPHGWIKPEQIIELIDYATSKYGRRVKFLTFKEAQQRLNDNLLAGQPLRAPDGQDNGVRLLDVNGDGYIDVVIGNDHLKQTRLWSPRTQSWINTSFPTTLVTADHADAGARFGIVTPDGLPSIIQRNETTAGAWHFNGLTWEDASATLLAGLDASVLTVHSGHDAGVRLRDLDGDGSCELIVGNPQQNVIYTRQNNRWTRLPFALPPGASIVDAAGRDAGLRFIDVDEDGFPDVLFSNDAHYALHLFTSMDAGWSRQIIAGKHGDKPVAEEIPKIVRDGTDNGMWVHSRTLWWRNESTAALLDHVDRRSFNQLLGDAEPTARSPEASLKSIRVAPGFTVELMAAEPLVQDPVAFAFGPDGKLWVVEMGDYPLGVDGHGKPGGRVKFLESSKHDGHYDKATVFLDDLPFPTGVTPWRKGVLVTCAPDIFYAEDTDGDGKADVRQVLYTGFSEGNQQHRVNTLAWGLDNWLHCANGHSGGKVKSLKTGDVVDISGRDFRIKPDEGLIEAETGVTQFGRARDDWGNWFGNDNSNPMFQFVLDDRYLRRNPSAAARDVRVQTSTQPGAAAVYPISRTLARFNDPAAANHFTSANSAIVYRDDLFGPLFSASTFVSEPVHNLVHRETLSQHGLLFSSTRPASEQESEFLASTDGWFRPTTLQTGPDGALWVCDMYRAVIEHPEWIPKDWQAKLDLRAGHDKGRLYRVFPVDRTPRPIPQLSSLDTAALVAALDSPSGWQRDTVQRLLIERHDESAIPLLKQMAQSNSRPLARLHALCTLDGLGGADEPTLLRALTDAHPGVRRHAIRVAEPLLTKSPALTAAVAKLVDDPDAHVQLQLAYSLGYSDDPAAAQALKQVAQRNAGDRFITAAVLSSLTKSNFDAIAAAFLDSPQEPSPSVLQGLIRSARALGGPELTSHVIAMLAKPTAADAAMRFRPTAAALDALERAGVNTDLAPLAPLLDAARHTATDGGAPAEARAAALPLLGRDPAARSQDLKLLVSLLSPKTAPALQSAAAEALAKSRTPEAPAALLAQWKTFGPALRAQVLDGLLPRTEGIAAILDGVEHRQILPTDLDPARRHRLLQTRDARLRNRAEKLLAQTTNPDRQKLVESYRDALMLTGRPDHGRELFAKTCAVCHKLGDVGAAVGPDLASIGNKSPDTLLVSILDPNAAVEARYTNYLADTTAGDSYSGVLTAETGTSITLAIPGGEQKTLLRSDLKSLRSTGLSLMPEGLEAGLSKQDVADLIAAIRGSAPSRTPKKFDGNHPQLVRVAPDGQLHLVPSTAEIYGKTLVLEPKYGNLGYWSSDDDEADWAVDVPAVGRYVVRLEYACEDAAAGNAFTLTCGAADLTGTAASTRTWDHYAKFRLGELTLPAGRQTVTLRAASPIKGALFDLLEIRLIPAQPESEK